MNTSRRPGGIRQQFKAAMPMVETLLKKLKVQPGLEGRMNAEILDDGDWIVVSQVFVSFTVRTDRQSLLSVGVFSNRHQVAAGILAIGLISTISYVPIMLSVFNTAALRIGDWALVAAFGLLALLADEARKGWHRRTSRASQRPQHAQRRDK